MYLQIKDTFLLNFICKQFSGGWLGFMWFYLVLIYFMRQETAKRDRKYRSMKLSPGFLFICVILNVKAVNCFISKAANSAKLRDKAEIELDQISLLITVVSGVLSKARLGCLSIYFMKLFCSVLKSLFQTKRELKCWIFREKVIILYIVVWFL